MEMRFDLQDNERVGSRKIYFDVKGCAPRLVVQQINSNSAMAY